MTGIMAALAGAGGQASGLDNFIMTTGVSGTLPNRIRGFNSSLSIGTLTPANSSIYGLPVTELDHDENLGQVFFRIPGATNSGWTTITITNAGGSFSFNRAAAAFSSGLWAWGSTYIFGANGTTSVVTLT